MATQFFRIAAQITMNGANSSVRIGSRFPAKTGLRFVYKCLFSRIMRKTLVQLRR